MIQLHQQLALFLDNRPGTLSRVCDLLADAKINILAMSSNDTVDHTVIRLVPSDPKQAVRLFEEHGVLVVTSEVLMVEGGNRPGSLARIAERLGRARINIEYTYFATLPSAKKGLLVLRVNNPKRAMKVLNLA